MAEPQAGRVISSRDNPHFKALKKAAHDSNAYRASGWVWLEGDHLCRAAVARGFKAIEWVISESFSPLVSESIEFVAIKKEVIKHGATVLNDALMSQLCTQDVRSKVAARFALPLQTRLQADLPTLVLDRVQDAGNVGSMLRSASAFGYTQVIALVGTAALWSPKVLRAGMGAQFGLQLHEGMATSDVLSLGMPLVATSSHGGAPLHTLQLPRPHAWLMGNEGAGVSVELMQQAQLKAMIAQPGGEESLNAAAAAAICLHHGAVFAFDPARAL